jgi:hypothetical protein
VIVTNPTDTTAGAFLTFMTPQAPPPNTRITKKKISSRRHRATLVFRAIGTASSFQCKLRRARAHKKAKFRPCRSPKTYKHLRAGRYTFSVRAIGPGGRDLSPAKAKFKIKPE